MKTIQQLALIILDGWGYREETEFNAIKLANPVYMDSVWNDYPHSLLSASGEAIGLLPGNIGTSEIGHLTIGSGRVIDTDVVRVFKSIEDHSLSTNPILVELFNHVKQNDTTLHLFGLLSPASVHSHQEHLFAILSLAKDARISNIIVHPFLDGRDTPPQSADIYLKQLEEVIKTLGVGKIGSMCGRYYGMDRDTNWDRTKQAEDMLFSANGRDFSDSTPSEAITTLYSESITDEFVPPCIFTPHTISQGDGVLFFNFRPDRARQITAKILDRSEKLNLYFASLTQYSKDLSTHILFPPLELQTSLSQEIAAAGLSQVHIAETEKYAHVTYFLNGGNENKHPQEEFILVESRKDVPTHDLAPEMKAKEIADIAIDHINSGTNFLAINIANADMVGHTGKLEPTIEAVRTIDREIKRIIEALHANGGVAFITADHGNAEEMVDENGQPKTAHTLNPVPGILTLSTVHMRQTGTLSDVAPTILSLFGLQQPASMTGKNLVEEIL
jgi:2,3-bisphosphoglycerate-independent phosphoglycerate mutase